MIAKKFFLSRNILIIALIIVQGMSIFNLINIIPTDINYNEIIFIIYGGSILNQNIVYAILTIMLYINLKEYSIYFNIYCMIKYRDLGQFIRKFIRKIIINISIFIGTINISFVLLIVLIGPSYINKKFMLYSIISSGVQILGLTVIFLFIVIINFFINRIIISVSIVFIAITLNDAILRVLKNSAKSISKIIFYKSSYEGFHLDIYNQIVIGISLIIILLGIGSILEKILSKKDLINENTK